MTKTKRTKTQEELNALFEIFKKKVIDGTYDEKTTLYAIAKELDINYEMVCRWSEKVNSVPADEIKNVIRVPITRKRVASPKHPIEQPKIVVPKSKLKFSSDWQWVRINTKESTKEKYDLLPMDKRADLWAVISQGIVDTDLENLGLKQEPIGSTTKGKRSSGVNIRLSPKAWDRWQSLPIRCNKNVYVRKLLEQML